MDEALDFANLFVDNQAGELLYFLLAVGFSLGALLIALDQRTRSRSEMTAMRYLLALTGVVFAWGVLTVGNMYTILAENADAGVIIPPLERMATALVILLLAWGFLTAESRHNQRAAFMTTGLVAALIIFGYSYTIITWGNSTPREALNQHHLGIAWALIPVFIAAGAGVLLVTRYQFAADIPLKLLFFGLVIVGHVYTLYLMGTDNLEGSDAGAVRVAMLAALALVPVILYRHVLDRFRETVDEVSGFVPTIAPSDIPAAAPPQPPAAPPDAAAQREAMSLLRILGMMLQDPDPRKIPQNIAKTVADALKGDMVMLAAMNDPHWADPITVYDFIREEMLPGLALSMDKQPTLGSAVELNMQMVILPTRNMEELTDLYTRLDVQTGYSPLGGAYFQPLSMNQVVIGMLIVAFPYSTRLLTDGERQLLEAMGPVAARLLAISREAAHIQPDTLVEGAVVPSPDAEREQALRKELHTQLESSQQQVDELGQHIALLKDQLTAERQKLNEIAATGESDMSITQRINLLSEERQKLQTEREELTVALQEAKALLASATANTDKDLMQSLVDTLENEKQALIAERQRLERELADLRGAPQDSTRLQDVLNTLNAERDRLAEEHQQLKAEIGSAERQLSELGIEGGVVGFTQLLAHLTEERNRFLRESKQAMAERDVLLRERRNFEQLRHQETQRSQQIENLERELGRLAADREVVIKQRDMLKAERETLNQQRDEWLDARVKLTEQYEQLRREHERIQTALQNQPATDNALQERLYEVEEHRSDLEFALNRAQDDIKLLESEIGRLNNVMRHGGEADEAILSNPEIIVGLAQELRTPLTSIMGYNELLLNESAGILGASQKQFLSRIQVNVEQLMQLIENLVRVLAIDYGKLLLAPVTVNVEDLVDDAITASSAQFREKGLNLSLNVAADMPDIKADRDAVQQILTRLMNNAYLATPADGAVAIAARYEPEFHFLGAQDRLAVIVFSITDQGAGIDDSEFDRVFSRHYRSENRLIHGLGDTGAGLSIAKALTEAHGGRIWFTSESGQGTTFHAAIPIDHAFGDTELQRGNVSRLIELFREGDAEMQSD